MKPEFRIGVVNFLNAYPLYYGLEKNKNVELIREIPSRLSLLLQNNRLNAALVSSIEYHRHRLKWKIHPGLCIASSGEVKSIRVFYNQNIENFPEDLKRLPGLKVYLDRASKSSVEMLNILLSMEFKEKSLEYTEVQPPFEDVLDNLQANELLILIGDAALRSTAKTSKDIGAWFFDTFGKPAVYAIWAYPKGDREGKIEELLNESYRFCLQHWNDMIEKAAKTFGFSLEFTRDYLNRNIEYNLDEEKKAGMDVFFTQYDLLVKQGKSLEDQKRI